MIRMSMNLSVVLYCTECHVIALPTLTKVPLVGPGGAWWKQLVHLEHRMWARTEEMIVLTISLLFLIRL